MRKLGLSIAVLAWLGCTGVAPVPTVDAVDLFLNALQFTPPNPAAVRARCDTGAALAKRRLQALATRTGAASIAEDFRRYDALLNLVNDLSYEMNLVGETSVMAPVRDAARSCGERIGAIVTDINLSRPIYDRLAAIPTTGLDPATGYALGRQLLAYRLAGVNRPAAERAKIARLNKDIIAVGLAFDRNISEDKTTVTLPPDSLEGMPQDFLDAHKPGADGKIHLTTAYPDALPVLTFASRQTTRKTIDAALWNRAYPVNDAVLSRLLAKRQDLAQALGEPDYATLVTKDKMVDSPARVQALLDELNGAAKVAAAHDLDRLLARYRQIEPQASEVQDWDSVYLRTLVKKEQFDVDGAEVRRYFTLDRTRDGIFQLVHDLFGSDIRPWQGAPRWAPGVTAWELFDGKRLVGRFYLDLSPRAGKFSHAAQFGLRTGVAGKRIPVGALICNFPATGPMEHGDVITFLHEFGHLVHFLYSGHQRYATQSMDQLQWDFVEAPSQLLEEWAWNYDTLKGFARNDEGAPIPAALVARMNAARRFGDALSWQRQLGFAAVSLYFHQLPAGLDLTKTYDDAYNRYASIKAPPGTHPYASFGHLTGYSATYYTYLWSKSVALDLFTRFRAEGMRNPATALAYRRAVLEPGASKPAAQLIRDFLGRDASTKAFRDDLQQQISAN
ncbi:M3 family metallopeptidase [Sphingomonas sp. TDK1]|uniref:M3 family metallopeptidase n=1 Tax=Sphingomonas sp. TDK1 TaxID=453247 RepID=UPI0007D95288|nr:M3 family metallopeptidase [Sphingomonas sp. TDK1]OAN66346.1 peptidase M3 [Sphingomonas sp. TDK1]